MARNVEIKARAADLAGAQAIAEELGDSPPSTLLQVDTFFHTPVGRLKLRELGEDRAELIHYQRADEAGPRESRYLISPTSAPGALKEVLASALGIRGVVRKERRLYLIGTTRIHLDRVEGLGSFLEIEVVLQPDQSIAAGEAIAAELMQKLSISRSDLVEVAYIDLLEGGPATPGAGRAGRPG